MAYDTELRRDTPLAAKLKQRIARDGPIIIGDYMSACLLDPDHGYYRKATAIGSAGDFITAPEISQVFGELIGLWWVIVWQQMGAPQRINVIELGPGRGTLMHDGLRAAAIVPEFMNAIHVHMVETNGPLAAAQRKLLKGYAGNISWHDAPETIPTGPSILIANEFLDTFPVDQFIKCSDGWHRQCVGLDAVGALCFTIDPQGVPTLDLLPGDTVPPSNTLPIETIQEHQDFSKLATTVASMARANPLAALFIDYGYQDTPTGVTHSGDTLQAVRNHAHEHPLTSPGEADLTCYVNFSKFERQTDELAKRAGTKVAFDGATSQTEFLAALGISERASRLMVANADRAGVIEAGVARLMAPQGMGGRFKVLGLRSEHLPPLPGLAMPANRADP